jgi:hypothetical protein
VENNDRGPNTGMGGDALMGEIAPTMLMRSLFTVAFTKLGASLAYYSDSRPLYESECLLICVKQC